MMVWYNPMMAFCAEFYGLLRQTDRVDEVLSCVILHPAFPTTQDSADLSTFIISRKTADGRRNVAYLAEPVLFL